jgi:NAD(P) transhydrogenase subunit alpha
MSVNLRQQISIRLWEYWLAVFFGMIGFSELLNAVVQASTTDWKQSSLLSRVVIAVFIASWSAWAAYKKQTRLSEGRQEMSGVDHIVINLIIFVLAIYVGYHVVWNVTPALHTPLMAVTNAISAIIIVGAMLAAALTETTLGKTMGVLAVALAAVNVFGGFLVTKRMLEMFKKKEKKEVKTEAAK